MPEAAGQLESWGPWASNLVNLGFLAWYAWHTTTKTIPGIIRDFRGELVDTRSTFAFELKETRAAFREEMAAERLQHKEELIAADHRWKNCVQGLISAKDLQSLKDQERQASQP